MQIRQYIKQYDDIRSSHLNNLTENIEPISTTNSIQESYNDPDEVKSYLNTAENRYHASSKSFASPIQFSSPISSSQHSPENMTKYDENQESWYDRSSLQLSKSSK